ncbi:MAG: hypothetical protein ACFCUU_07015 [Cyclobacteriaceae bacterium]
MKKVRLLFIVLFFSNSLLLKASHIVGGEFEMNHIEDYTYNIKLILYFDLVNGLPGAKDRSANAFIYRKHDDVLVGIVGLSLRSEVEVNYSNPKCTHESLRTSKLEYATNYYLDPQWFGHPEGYYMVYERCCRNEIITNIVSPVETGQTFYLEFPPVVKDNEPFINSSPQLFPPLSDYACLGRDFYVDFRGIDPDGDSLVYSLAEPYNSSTIAAVPTPSKRPHPPVAWIHDFTGDNPIPGDPPLSINSEGFLTIKPTDEGLFVFSVLCEEYRDNVKIGEVRRDFQMFVIECPYPGEAPVLVARDPVTQEFVKELDPVQITLDGDRCIELAVTDEDGKQGIRFRARPVNFTGDINQYLTQSGGRLETENDTLFTKICLPECAIADVNPLIFDVIAGDDTCPLSLKDTIRITAYVETLGNSPPTFVTPNQRENEFVMTLGENQVEFEIKATDPDLDSMHFFFHSGFTSSFEEVNLSLDTIVNTKGEISFKLTWDPDCTIFPINEKSDFVWYFVVQELDACGIKSTDTVLYNIKVLPLENTAPKLTLNGSEDNREFTVYLGDDISFRLEGTDEDIGDKLFISATSTPFHISSWGMNLEGSNGTQEAHLDFYWEPPCSGFSSVPYSATLKFVLRDENPCKYPNYDTIDVVIRVLPRDNTPPIFSKIEGLINDTLHVVAGTILDIPITASDEDNDVVLLKLNNPDQYKRA